ncbi:hypothetical protein PTSG_01512 [Salpingoeca rosetta]|uniref:Echinoderm microtubule-associated protein-like 6 n=1 Tax=Salpingoeca rosetta (strain ATCC 50818 / BSB-021) TaxID=946362 RepID=F2U0K1_SALR5|nr:uncharacterized protein PTSG_01512 [Salpingoeca rosetta]EGD80929.1 hypothetical protein PTSG_01512 [Salpingoeca rosetta]|eukprot:XP_004997490.1 hypothetical protein PTSG_01512 [Salpingoeca rosetta]
MSGMPEQQLRLHRVHGYRGHQVRHSATFANDTNSVVYIVAGLAIVWTDGEQRFYYEHTDDIISLSLHEDDVTAATGQVGAEPFICIWDTESMETKAMLKGHHKLGIASIRFGTGNQAKILVSCGLESSHNIVVWDWTKGLALAVTPGHNKRVFDAQISPWKGNRIVSCGVDHVKFWTLAGNTMTTRTGTFDGMRDTDTQLCLAFEPPESKTERVFTSSLGGAVTAWQTKDGSPLNTVQCHQGPVFVMDCTPNGLATGGKDGFMRLWELDLSPIAELDINAILQESAVTLRTVCWAGDKILVGTKDSQLYIVKGSDKMNPTCVTQGHRPGELWGLAISPDGRTFVTASDDGSVRLWAFDAPTCVKTSELQSPLRCCQFNPAGTHVAAAGKGGTVFILTPDLEHVKQQFKVRDNSVDVIAYTANDLFVAGSGDGFIDVYDPRSKYKHVTGGQICDSFIAHIDLMDNPDEIMVTSGTGDLIRVRLSDVKIVKSEDASTATVTSPALPMVKGIWGPYADCNDVNVVATCDGAVVSGDDYGNVKLFNFPCPEAGALHRTYKGHSAHVTNIAFDPSGRWMVTTGGADQSVFVWKYHPEGGLESIEYDSEEGVSDYEDEDLDALDSDVETEVQVDYSRKKTPPPPAAKAAKVSRKPPPLHSARLSHVHGYRGYDCRNNLFYDSSLDVLIYHIAALAIVVDMKTWEQSFYVGHTDDILCLAHHPEDDLVATGQVGKDPPIHIWHLKERKALSILKGSHSRGVCAVSFHPDGKRLVSVGLDNDHSICLWDWAKGVCVATTRGHKDKIFAIGFNPSDPAKIVTVGMKHIKFWTQKGNGFSSKRGLFGKKGKVETMLCLTFGANGHTYTGSSSGIVCIWSENTLERTVQAHKGPLFAIHALEQAFLTGGKDGMIRIWGPDFKRALHEFSISQDRVTNDCLLTVDKPAIRALEAENGLIFAGTSNGEVLLLDDTGNIKVVAQGHAAGELWGLAPHPTQQIVATTSDDKTLRVWDLDARKQIALLKLPTASRSVAFNHDATLVAVGFKNGAVHVYAYPPKPGAAPVHKAHHRKEDISDIKFSPKGDLCAVASHDNFVDIYQMSDFHRVGVCKGPSSYITHVDWDMSGQLLMTNSGAKELLYFRAPKGKIQPISKSAAANVEWETWTSVLGPSVIGIWPPSSDVTDVNASCLSHDRKILATADDFGMVKLFDFPVTTAHAKHKKYIGHSAHVTSVRFTAGDKKLVSIGGNDTSLIVWDFGAAESMADADEVHHQFSDASDTDSEEEGYDSDVTRERSIDYTTKAYHSRQDPSDRQSKIAKRRSNAKKNKFGRGRAHAAKSKPAIKSLKLHFIHGYRAYDARNNLRFIDRETIVFHAAGACVVMNITTRQQKFYLQHTDDVLCLAVNPRKPSFIATGQVGESPSVHVWNAQTMETASIISGAHDVGVGSVSFSSNGKVLLSVGVAEKPRICIHRWQTGVELCSAQTNHRIFVASFRPDSDVEFVTAGIKHLHFWTITGSSVIHKRGITGPNIKMTTMLGVAFGQGDVTFSSAMNGDVWIWKGTKLMKTVKAHDRPCFAMATDVTRAGRHIITGGKDGYVRVWDEKMKQKAEMHLPGEELRSVCRGANDQYLVGTEGGSVYIVRPGTQPERVLSGHGEGELWALATASKADKFDFVTASDDKTLRFWKLDPPALALPIINLPERARCVCLGQDDNLCCVSLENGEFLLFNMSNLDEKPQSKRDRGKAIRCIKLSPDESVLAVVSNDVAVDFYDVASLNRLGYCRDLKKPIAHIDWSEDGKHLRLETSSYDVVYVEAPTGKLVKKPDKVKWATRTGVFDDNVLGIWPKGGDKVNINCAARSTASNAVVTGDDMGFVKLFAYPCPESHARPSTYVGHAAQVTSIAFVNNDNFVVSTGGDDNSILVWKTAKSTYGQ